MKYQRSIFASFLLTCFFVAGSSIAQAPAVQEPSSETDIKNALTGGVPMGDGKKACFSRA